MKILLADDNNSSRQSVANFLRKIGYRVDEYNDGYEALKGFLINSYEMVLTDIKMPHMDGIELLKSISASPYWNSVDVVLFTGYGDLDTAIKALRLGAFDYLLKPIDVKELAQVTEKIAERRKKSRKKINIMLVHNNSLYGEGLKYIFTRSYKFRFIGDVGNFKEAVDMLEINEVDIMLVDTDFAIENRANIEKIIKNRFPKLNIVLLYSNEELVSDDIRECASGCIPKDTEVEEIIFFLEQLYKGFDVSSFFTSSFALEIENVIEQLTPVEYQVLKLLGQGLTNKEIAENLFISYSTVRTYVSKIYQKLDVPNRAAAAAFAVKCIE